MSKQIWNTDESQQDLWATDPARAARIAYFEVMMLWHDQVESGQYGGVPVFDETSPHHESEQNTVRSRPPRHTPDAAASEWEVPAELRVRFGAVG